MFAFFNAANTILPKFSKRMIGVLGCMAQNLKNDLMESKPYVDVILGPDSYRKIPEILESRSRTNGHFVDTKLSKFEIYEDLFPTRKSGVNAWVSIMRGCDKFCTFCIVPFTRGRERSRGMEGIIKEVEEAVSKGFVEITPEEVREFFFSIPEDERPVFSAEVEVAQIVVEPQITKEAKQEAIDRLNQMRQDIVENGVSFATKAGLYSEDGSKTRGGLIEGVQRNSQYVKEFKDQAFSLLERKRKRGEGQSHVKCSRDLTVLK